MADVAFLWHMHQPNYVNPSSSMALMPWVRLHSVKGYLDMIVLLEEFPDVHVNFNVTPVLSQQIEQLADGTVRDLWLEWSRTPASDLTDEVRFAILENFFKIHWDNLVKPHARYWELLNKRGLTFYHDEVRRSLRYFSTQEMLDLQVWFNLGWTGYIAERLYPELLELKKKGRDFTEAEKNRVLDIHMEIVRGLLQRYRAAEERGQVELTTTPFFHPILPLVYDSDLAERCLPGRARPKRFHHPEDARAQMQLAMEQHTRTFGKPPRGLWPSEGSVAPELVPLWEELGLKYICTDEANLFNSLAQDPQRAKADHLELFQGWQITHGGSKINAVFRERPLSDFIGFTAAKNDARQAAGHLLLHLRHIAGQIPKQSGLISIMLDGENAWETFTDGGQGFLRALYGGLTAPEGGLQSVTIENHLLRCPPKPEATVKHLHTGSWIQSNFDIWIGEPEENRAWDLLGETRDFLEKQIQHGKLSPTQERNAKWAIYAAEGSDWFWWYGPDFSTENDALFDDLFRQHLKSVYRACGSLYPAELDLPIGQAAVKPMYEPPETFISPVIDGQEAGFYEWQGAGTYIPGGESGAMYRSERVASRLFFGADARNFYFRMDMRKREPVTLHLTFHEPEGYAASTQVLEEGKWQQLTITTPDGHSVVRNTAAAGDVVECSIPLSDLKLHLGGKISFQVRVSKQGVESECYPENVPIEFTLLDERWALEHWVV